MFSIIGCNKNKTPFGQCKFTILDILGECTDVLSKNAYYTIQEVCINLLFFFFFFFFFDKTSVHYVSSIKLYKNIKTFI
jgi:hypothetical protein